jgi:hypothetical protein
MAQSGHLDCVEGCPFSEVKRTSKFKSVTSAFDPKRTWRRAASGRLQCNRSAMVDPELMIRKLIGWLLIRPSFQAEVGRARSRAACPPETF